MWRRLIRLGFETALALQIVNISHMRAAQCRSLRMRSCLAELKRDKLGPEAGCAESPSSQGQDDRQGWVRAIKQYKIDVEKVNPIGV